MNKRPFTNTIFGDARLSLRANFVMQEIVSSGTSVINRVHTTMSEKVGAYRLLNNDRVMRIAGSAPSSLGANMSCAFRIPVR